LLIVILRIPISEEIFRFHVSFLAVSFLLIERSLYLSPYFLSIAHDYIHQLVKERAACDSKMNKIQQQIEEMNAEIK